MFIPITCHKRDQWADGWTIRHKAGTRIFFGYYFADN